MRRFGSPRKRDQRYTLRPGAYAILTRGADVLITHQSGMFDEYQLPGGGIDPGETSVVALHREVMEETGWKIAQPQRIGVYRRFTYMPEYDLWAEKICHIFTARPLRRIGPPIEPDHNAVWTDTATAMRVLCNDGDRHFVERYSRFGK